MLSERIGGKWPFGIGMLVTAIFSLVTPWAARSGKGVLIIVRIIQGLGEVRTNYGKVSVPSPRGIKFLIE
jgi:MFS family permease